MQFRQPTPQDSRQLLERLVSGGSISKKTASMLTVKEISSDDIFIKVNFAKNEDADAHPELSELRGCTFDRRTGSRVCGGSTYTRKATANSLTLENGIIPITLKNGKVTEVNYSAALDSTDEAGVNLAIPSSRAFIRPYMEGTVIMLTKSNGRVFVQNHSHIDIRIYSSSDTRMGSYQGVNFWEAALKAANLDPERFFPEECSDSPFCFRFLVTVPALMKGSRLFVDWDGCLTFLGVQVLWNHDTVEKPGPYAYYESEDAALSRRPLVKSPDLRTRDELLDLARYIGDVPIVTDLMANGRPAGGFVYYPELGFDLERANDFLLNGPRYGDDHEQENARYLELHTGLGIGDSIIVTHEITSNNKVYYESIRVVSEACRHRMKIQGDRMAFNGLLEFVDSPKIDQPINYIAGDNGNLMLAQMLSISQPFFHPPLAATPGPHDNVLAKQNACANYFTFCCTPAVHVPLMEAWVKFVNDRKQLTDWVLSFSESDPRFIMMSAIKEHVISLLSTLRHSLTGQHGVIERALNSSKLVTVNLLIMAMDNDNKNSLSKVFAPVGKRYETKAQKAQRQVNLKDKTRVARDAKSQREGEITSRQEASRGARGRGTRGTRGTGTRGTPK